MPSHKKYILYKILLILGIFLIVDALALIIFQRSTNVGTFAPGTLGIILVLISIVKIYIKPSENVIKNKLLKTLLIASIAAFTLSFIIIEGIIIAYSYPDKISNPDYVMILGGGLKGEELSYTLLKRLNKGLEYLKKNAQIKVIVSGGKGMGEDITEGEAMKRYLIQNEIDESRIIVEEKSTSTMENFKFTRKLLKISSQNNQSLLIVTSDSHMFRSRILAKRNGFVPYGLPCKTPLTTIFNNYVREYFAVIKSMILDYN